MYRQWGGDIINMSVIPEAKLAREAELEYVQSLPYCTTASVNLHIATPSSVLQPITMPGELAMPP
jgi:purine nucleoside phosphorylase